MNRLLNSIFTIKKKTVDVTIVLNIWKRKYLNEQLNSLCKQTVRAKEIWIIHYETHFNISEIIKEFEGLLPPIIVIESSKNLKFFGRFSVAININTKFIWILDDDIIPGELWLERSCKKCESLNSIISCTGRIIPRNDYQPEKPSNLSLNYFIGDVHGHKDDITFCKEQKVVDFACQSYFFKSEWLRIFWSIWPITFLSGEDIHLSATCKQVLNINTTVLKQTNLRNSGSIKKRYGGDEFATFKKNNFLELREKVFRYHIIENNWKPVLW